MNNTLFLPAWSIGPDVYNEVYGIVRPRGTKVAVIGGKTAMAKALPALTAALAGTDLELSEPIWFGGEASYENADMLAEMAEVKNADMIFAIGGGRAVDTCKMTADKLDKPLYTFPTLSSNCAGCTTIAITYYPDGAMRDIFYPKRCPIHTFMNSTIIASSPEQYLWAGIGDSLAKEFESEFASRNDVANNDTTHEGLMGIALARCCTGPLTGYGAKALEQIRNHEDGYELQQVVLAIVITAGLVSNMTSDPERFYNSSMAHAFYDGCTVCPGAHKHLHGELVSLGILVLLTLDKQFERRDALLPFYDSIKLPITMDDVELKEEDLDALYELAHNTTEWAACSYYPTKEEFVQAILDTDAAGKAFRANR